MTNLIEAGSPCSLVDPEQECRTPPEAPITIIRPARACQWLDVRELWQFRELIFFLAWRDVKVRYKQTVLGAAWAVLQPLMMMAVFTIFFGRMAHVSSGDWPYPVFVYAGLLPWMFFAGAVGSAAQSVVGSERLITKVYFPRLAIPFAAVGATVVDFAVAFVILLVLMLFYGLTPGPGLLLIPVLFGFILLAAVGVGTLLAALNVAYRDFRYVVPFLLQLWMFATPSVYMQLPTEPSGTQALLACNPLVALIEAFRSAVLGGPIPWGSWSIAAAGAVLMFSIGCLYFRKVEDSFADII